MKDVNYLFVIILYFLVTFLFYYCEMKLKKKDLCYCDLAGFITTGYVVVTVYLKVTELLLYFLEYVSRLPVSVGISAKSLGFQSH